jgi:hypothetical protein
VHINWSEPGYPPRHHDAVRSATAYAVRAIALTVCVFCVLLLGTVFASVPPVLAALAGAVFLLFGLLGGIGGLYDTRRFVRVIPYFQRKVGGICTFAAGQSLARCLRQLDAVAAELQVTPLSAFGFHDDLRGESLTWHAPDEGLHTVTTLLSELQVLAEQEGIPAGVLRDLRAWKHALERATAQGISFCILLRHGNATSAQEWDVRQGTAF